MKSIFNSVFISMIALFFCFACGNKPRVISSATDGESGQTENTGIFSSDGLPPPIGEAQAGAVNKDDVHTVVAKEVLPTTKYVYMYVSEGEEDFWIATSKQEVEVGETYFYKGGLLKTNFESKEHNRIFDRMYLVSRVVPVNHGGSSAASASTSPETAAPETDSGPRNIEREGSVRIAELVDNPEKYNGQTVQISGECVKVNPNIMGRNWMHLKDGSNDDYDLVITSNLAVPEGHVVTMKGIVVLNKDFGAGYRYDILIENGEIVQ